MTIGTVLLVLEVHRLQQHIAFDWGLWTLCHDVYLKSAILITMNIYLKTEIRSTSE